MYSYNSLIFTFQYILNLQNFNLNPNFDVVFKLLRKSNFLNKF